MIYIGLDGHDFKYELEDTVGLFFKRNEIVFIESEPPAEYRGIFLLIRLTGKGEQLLVLTRLEVDGELYSENEYSISEEVSALVGSDKLEFQKKLKREIKRQAYMSLKIYTGKVPPWGILTGIRPAKIVNEMLEKGKQRDEILSRLNEYYRVSAPKAELLYNVAMVERGILNKTKRDTIGLYIGIPFCRTRCLYCSFTSNLISKYSKFVDSYLDALKAELTGVCEIMKRNALRVQSIYIGGGTPTSIDTGDLKKLLGFIEESIDFDSVEEYTLEAGRPDSISRDKLEAVKNSRVGRISINPQTMNDDTLKVIGRNHSSGDIINSFNLAREIGFNNINMDVIVGLPGENISMFENTLQEIKKLGPESLTVHTMAIKRASRLTEEKGEYNLIQGLEASEMVDMAQKYASCMQMHPYYLYRQKNILGNLENIGYCKPGFESIYNVQIMEEKQTIIALGAGAVTKVIYPDENRIERAPNVKGVEEYIRRLGEMVERKRAFLEV